jgi:hypothetical protein
MHAMILKYLINFIKINLEEMDTPIFLKYMIEQNMLDM